MVDWTKQELSVELAERAVVVHKGEPVNGGQGLERAKRRHSSLFRQISNIVCDGGHSRSYAELDVCDLAHMYHSPDDLAFPDFDDLDSPRGTRLLNSTQDSPRGCRSPTQKRAVSQQERRELATSQTSSPAKDRMVHSAWGRMQNNIKFVESMKSRCKLFSRKKPMGSEVYVQEEMSDVEAIAWLTRAPAGCPTREAVCTEREKTIKHLQSPRNKAKLRSWAEAPKLFREATPGSDYRPTSRYCSSSSRAGSPTGSPKKCFVKMETHEIGIIDEDPVVALFDAENMAKCKTRRGAVTAAVSAIDRMVNKRGSQRWAKVRMVMIDQKKDQKRKETGEPKISPQWDNLLKAIVPAIGEPQRKTSNAKETKSVLTNAKRHACEVVRRFFWGAVGNEHAKTAHEALEMLYISTATADQVDRLWRMWKRLDITRNGQVDSTAFLRVAHSSKGGDSRPGERVIRVLLEKKTHCTLDEVIRVLWPCATAADLDAVNKQLEELREGTREAETPAPPLLAAAELEGLVRNFEHLAASRKHLADSEEVIGLYEIIQSELLDIDDAEKYFKRYGKSPNDLINCAEFCEMFCPDGFRATPNSRTATDEDGNRLVLSNGVWRSTSEM